MKLICVIDPEGAAAHLAPSPRLANNISRQPCGTILEAVGKVTAAGVVYYVVLKPKKLFVPVGQVALVEDI